MNKNSPDDVLILRVDASTAMGTGHVMRCLALAAAWQNASKVYMVCSQVPAALRLKIEDAGYNFVDLEAPHPALPDLAIMRELLKQHQAYVVLDGYHFDEMYQAEIRRMAGRLMVIDDYNHLPAYDSDILLNQNVGSDVLKYNCNPGCRILTGPRYSLLRPEFIKRLRDRRREFLPTAKKLLVSMGGADASNMTLEILKVLEQLPLADLEVAVVLGPANTHLASITEFTGRSKYGYRILRNIGDMTEVMDWAEVGISAGGSTCWELCFLGLPFFVFSLAENQRIVAHGLEENGAAILCHKPADLLQRLEAVLEDSEQRRSMSRKGQALVDGRGVYRALSALRGGQGCLLPASPEYCEVLWPLANDSLARRLSVMPIPADFEAFCTWFSERMAKDNEPVLFLESPGGETIGYISFEDCQATSKPTLTLCLSEKWRGQGLGVLLLREGCLQFFRMVPGAETLDALITPDAGAIYGLLVLIGFERVDTVEYNGREAYVMRLSRQRFFS